MDPFAVFGMTPTLEVDRTWLEARYLELSRESHPDHHRGEAGSDDLAVLTRSADVNEAYRRLRDPWQRTEDLLEVEAPGALSANKTLAPDFLAEALELAERVAAARGSTDAEALRAELVGRVEAAWSEVRRAVASKDWSGAATLLHQARYHRKALRDLSP